MYQPSVTSLVIKEFRDGLPRDETWRVDWLGELIRRHGRMGQHHIQVFLSPVHASHAGLITASDAVDHQRQLLVEVGVGYLPVLHIGATVMNGELQQQKLKRFRRLRIPMALDPSLGQYLRFDSLVERFRAQPPKPLVFPGEYRAGSRAWRSASKSTVFSVPDVARVDPHYVLIPCIELIRFFFCTSSTLATHLFANAWGDLIWDAGSNTSGLPDEITVGTRTVKGVRAIEARHLALMIADPKTEQAVHSIHQSLQTTRSSGPLESVLKCPIPFDEPTTIEADVVEISTGTSVGKRYFVTRLHRCQRPIPFRVCYWNPMMNSNPGSNEASPDLIPMSVGASTEISDEGAEEVSDGGRVAVPRGVDAVRSSGMTGDDLGNPGGYLEEVNHWVDEDRFPGLRDIHVEIAAKDRQTHRYEPSKKRPLLVDVTQASTASASRGSNQVLAAHIRTDPDSSEQDILKDTFIKLLQDCAQWLTDLQYDVRVMPLQSLKPSSRSRGQRNWATIWSVDHANGIGKRGRRRVMACLEIRVGDLVIIVAEIERRRSAESTESFALAAFSFMASASTSSCVQSIASSVNEREGWPEDGAKGELPWIAMRRMSHRTRESAVELAQRIDALLITPLRMSAS